MIRYLRHEEIEKNKWDDCIRNSLNSLIDAYSWFLDIVSPGWDALVDDNYIAVMPLTWKKKWGIHYLYKPYFTQQLGIFAPADTNRRFTSEFIRSIPAKFRYINILLNRFNDVPYLDGMIISRNANQEISLNSSYNDLYNSFNRNCHRNIRTAENSGLTISAIKSPGLFADFVCRNLGVRISGLSDIDYRRLIRILESAISKEMGELYGVYTHSRELAAAGSFLVSPERCIFHVCASSPEGKKHQAMYMLVSNQIRKYAGSGKTFDFSGSNLKGIAYFNSTFGAGVLEYPGIVINRLPWPLKALKK